jgi:hypothetical protein
MKEHDGKNLDDVRIDRPSKKHLTVRTEITDRETQKPDRARKAQSICSH